MAEITDKIPQGRLVSLIIDEATIPQQRAPIEQERRIAVANLLDSNGFIVTGLCKGSYYGVLEQQDSRLLFNLTDEQGARAQVAIDLMKLGGVVKDYRIVCENYYQAIADSPPSTIETLDAARRALHDDGAQMIREDIEPDVIVDYETSRGLLTLVAAILLRS